MSVLEEVLMLTNMSKLSAEYREKSTALLLFAPNQPLLPMPAVIKSPKQRLAPPPGLAAAPGNIAVTWMEPGILLLEDTVESNSSVLVPVPFHQVPQSRVVSVGSPPGWMAPGGMGMVAVWAFAAPGQQANAKPAITEGINFCKVGFGFISFRY